jgi:hypothetical protein
LPTPSNESEHSREERAGLFFFFCRVGERRRRGEGERGIVPARMHACSWLLNVTHKIYLFVPLDAGREEEKEEVVEVT